MESTEKCEAIIQHFNGKYIKTPPGVPGEFSVFLLDIDELTCCLKNVYINVTEYSIYFPIPWFSAARALVV